MKRHDRVTITKLADFDASDFGLSPAEYANLLEHEGATGTVECEATDGYFDVILDDGTSIAAISSYHLTVEVTT